MRAHAIVVGGSIGGLLVARVLSERFGRVTVVERDVLPADDALRPGAPQARHLHALLSRGLRVFDELFPGLSAELRRRGAPVVEHGVDFRTLYPSGWHPIGATGLVLCPSARGLLEHAIRERVRGLANVTLLAPCTVHGLVSRGGRVRGVRVDGGGAGPRELEADFAVDASGRGSRAPQWLDALGYGRPEETVVDAAWGYASRVYARPATAPTQWRGLLSLGRPPDCRRTGVLQPVEGDRWLVTLAGVLDEHPPTDEEGFLQFARGLRTPLIHDAVRTARPLTPVRGYRHTANRRRHYERMRSWPDGFVVAGDALCAFNPVYGQGMTVCGLEAVEVGAALDGVRGLPAGFARRLQRRLARVVAAPWLMATGEDLRWEGTVGARAGRATRLLHWYVDRVIARIPADPEVFRAFAEVGHLLRRPAALFHPRLVARVLLPRDGATLQRWRAADATAGPLTP
jgi:2-polyprenyl-6-methoxyphenol hydroxylase-like FAD-dependent oxidoreductase